MKNRVDPSVFRTRPQSFSDIGTTTYIRKGHSPVFSEAGPNLPALNSESPDAKGDDLGDETSATDEKGNDLEKEGYPYGVGGPSHGHHDPCDDDDCVGGPSHGHGDDDDDDDDGDDDGVGGPSHGHGDGDDDDDGVAGPSHGHHHPHDANGEPNP